MRQSCPVCGKRIIAEGIPEKSLSKTKHFPFCSERCKLIDLNAWFDADYVISGPNQNDDEIKQ